MFLRSIYGLGRVRDPLNRFIIVMVHMLSLRVVQPSGPIGTRAVHRPDGIRAASSRIFDPGLGTVWRGQR